MPASERWAFVRCGFAYGITEGTTFTIKIDLLGLSCFGKDTRIDEVKAGALIRRQGQIIGAHKSSSPQFNDNSCGQATAELVTLNSGRRR
jgi:hypothetical protein